MTEIVALLQLVNHPSVKKPAKHILCLLSLALLAMSGRITMLNISRWTEQGGSYRTLQRFFDEEIEWAELFVVMVSVWFIKPGETVLLVGDTTVISKSGKQTFGVDRFFHSVIGKPVQGLAFEALSVVNPTTRQSYPVRMMQLVKQANPTKPPSKLKKEHKRRGRPKGSKNKNRRSVVFSEQQERHQKWIKATKRLLNSCRIQVTHFVYDGAFGNNVSAQLVQQCGLHLISKLRRDSALYFPYEGVQKMQGANRKYGQKLEYDRLSEVHLKSSTMEKGIQTDVFQMTLWHKRFADQLNIVIIRKTKVTHNKVAHIVLFSTDLTQGHQQMTDYYCLRFQIEFNFRDAKQFWGLEDFMNVKQRRVHNFANLSMMMVNVAHKLIESRRITQPYFSVNDLKAEFRGRKYALELLKLLPELPNELLIDSFFDQIGKLGSINVNRVT